MNFRIRARTPSGTVVAQLKRSVRGFWVPVKPHPTAKPTFCDKNVTAQIRDHGGEPVSVWDVTETGQLVELEAHIIWKSPSGELLDVSPSWVGAERHFVILAQAPFQRPFPGNRIFALSSDPQLRESARYLSLAHALMAPHRCIGVNVFTPPNIRMWVHDFLARENIPANPTALEKVCLAVVRNWNVNGSTPSPAAD